MKLTDEDMLKLLNSSDSTSELVLLGRTIPLEYFKAVLEILGGSTGCEIYVQSKCKFFERLHVRFRDNDITTHYQEGMAGIFAKKYKISERRVYQIVERAAKEVNHG